VNAVLEAFAGFEDVSDTFANDIFVCKRALMVLIYFRRIERLRKNTIMRSVAQWTKYCVVSLCERYQLSHSVSADENAGGLPVKTFESEAIRRLQPLHTKTVDSRDAFMRLLIP